MSTPTTSPNNPIIGVLRSDCPRFADPEDFGTTQDVLDGLWDYDEMKLLPNGTLLCFAYPDRSNDRDATRPYYQTIMALVDAKTGTELYRALLVPHGATVLIAEHVWPTPEIDARPENVALYAQINADMKACLDSLPPSPIKSINTIASTQTDGSIQLKRKNGAIVLYDTHNGSTLGVVEADKLPNILTAMEAGTDILAAVDQVQQ